MPAAMLLLLLDSRRLDSPLIETCKQMLDDNQRCGTGPGPDLEASGPRGQTSADGSFELANSEVRRRNPLLLSRLLNEKRKGSK